MSKINNIVINNKNLTNSADTSDAFNTFFTNAATHLDHKLPKSNLDPISNLPPRMPQSMPIPHTNISEIVNVIKSLKNKKCSVKDFSPLILKRIAHLIAQPLTLLFNQSIQQGKFPYKLKQAHVTPIYKKGAKSDPNKYRPISLLNVFSKIFEKVMKNKFVHFIDSHKILSPSQFGF